MKADLSRTSHCQVIWGESRYRRYPPAAGGGRRGTGDAAAAVGQPAQATLAVRPCWRAPANGPRSQLASSDSSLLFGSARQSVWSGGVSAR
ncbi:hypothetical protein FRACA_980008 [Frankia canadensis]|uniref:Uncharacterized protein n=1 Tax=Frankia canadensis TaxID=1836972 RepID=A0A2I2L2W6_9ACTN|nr:hypothetical protein FRACA_980008 [Frankia canadensis]SOU59535.1 hypothetical protein FRACA_980008 [Frankia canadensis]